MHVLFIPKWYPGRNDPQLGDFLRKQAAAVATYVRLSVLFIAPDVNARKRYEEELTEAEGLWELRVHYRASTHAFRPFRKGINFLRYWRAAMRGYRRVREQRGKPDLTHAYILVRPALVAWWLKQRWGIPYLVSEQSSEYLDGTYAGKSAVVKGVHRALFRAASGVSVVSAWLGDALVNAGLCTDPDIVPNVVPGLDRPLPPPGPPGDFLMVADLVDRTKNISGVLRALTVARNGDPRIRLTVIGDGPDRAELQSLAQELGTNGSVTFLGRLPNAEVLDHMGNAGAVVVNSRVETFSVVTGEALAQGKPVIASRCGGPVAFINDRNGILIDVGDDHALSLAMLSIANAEAGYSAQEIRAGVSDRFSPKAVGKALAAIYERIHHGRG